MSSAAAHSSPAAAGDVPKPRRKPRPRPKKKTESLAQPSGNNNSADNNNRPAAPTSGDRPRPNKKTDAQAQAQATGKDYAGDQQVSATAHTSAADDIPRSRPKPRLNPTRRNKAQAQASANDYATDQQESAAGPASSDRPRPTRKKGTAKGSGNQQNGTEEKKGLTPYQGSKRSFGMFKCPTCKKTWASAHTWANMGQECSECLVNVYPFMQRKLEKGENNNAPKPHLEKFCEKCQYLSFSCTKLRHHYT